MTSENEYRLGRRAYHRNQEESVGLILVLVTLLLLAVGSYILVARFHLRPAQLIEGGLYLLFASTGCISVAWYVITLPRRRETTWPHPPFYITAEKDRKAVQAAYDQNAIVLGYDVHRKPWLWPDATRVMQSVVFGATGSGKTTLLKNIITQDLFRVVGPANDQRRMPMLIFDGKGDQEFLSDLLPAMEAAGRMHQLRVLNPSRPDISVRYNPFFSEHGLYQEHANFVFESFDLKEDFFHGHQATYLSDLVRVLAHTGKRFNIHDVLVLALDERVLKEQIAIARGQLSTQAGVTRQRELNLEMSIRNLQQSFEDRERVPKIQGLLNELMTFLEDDLSAVTGAYNEVLSLDEVIEKDLILFVSLNTNKNSKAVTALGRMLLQNMQLIIPFQQAGIVRHRQTRLTVIKEKKTRLSYYPWSENNADGPGEDGRQMIAQGFLARGNRINVALSRAMDKLIVVGASESWPSDSPLARVASEFNALSQQGESEFLKAAKWEPEPKRPFKIRRKRPSRKMTPIVRDRHE